MTSQDGLALLKQMHQRGEITDEQYDALRRHVLWGTPLPDLEDVPSPRSGADPVLPHPRMRERRFVLAPLSEIAPDWRHPVGGESAAELLRALPARPAVRRLSSTRRGSSARRSGS